MQWYRKDANIDHKGKVPSKAAIAENWTDLITQKFGTLCIIFKSISTYAVIVYDCCENQLSERKQKQTKMLKVGGGRANKDQCIS